MIARTRKTSPPPEHWEQGTVFTIGHSNHPIERFIALLQSYGIEQVLDIRTIPRSRHNPQFNETALARSLKAAGIAYSRLPGLGGLRHARKDSINTGWHNESFRGFADYMATEPFADALGVLVETSRSRRTAIMCAEAVPWRCHRSLVGDALTVRGIPVIEILSERSHRTHSLTPFAKVSGDRITYP